MIRSLKQNEDCENKKAKTEPLVSTTAAIVTSGAGNVTTFLDVIGIYEILVLISQHLGHPRADREFSIKGYRTGSRRFPNPIKPIRYFSALNKEMTEFLKKKNFSCCGHYSSTFDLGCLDPGCLICKNCHECVLCAKCTARLATVARVDAKRAVLAWYAEKGMDDDLVKERSVEIAGYALEDGRETDSEDIPSEEDSGEVELRYADKWVDKVVKQLADEHQGRVNCLHLRNLFKHFGTQCTVDSDCLCFKNSKESLSELESESEDECELAPHEVDYEDPRTESCSWYGDGVADIHHYLITTEEPSVFL